MHPLGTFEKVQPQWQLLYLFFWECTSVIVPNCAVRTSWFGACRRDYVRQFTVFQQQEDIKKKAWESRYLT